MKFDVLCFGSATCDIYLISDEFRRKNDGDNPLICQPYGGKVAIDKYEVTTGGGATNSGVCFERLGLQAATIACVGEDHWGRVVRQELDKEGVSLVHLQKTSEKETSSSVALVGKDGGRTSLVYRAASNLLDEKEINWEGLNGRWVYASSLGGNFKMLDKIVKLARGKKMKISFNPGGSELKERIKLKEFLAFINLLIVNKEEMERLLEDNVNKDNILKLGLEMVLVTNGDKGAKLYLGNGEIIKRDIYPGEAVEVTGAGDSFGSTFVAGILRGFSLDKSLLMAAINSKSVVGEIGPKKGLMFWPEMKKLLDESG
jgi:sugar/nucleoside kinase (ribokinase family)